MTDNKSTPRPDPEPAEEQDVEGHNMWIDPGIQRDLARIRHKDLEREVRDRNHAKEAKRS